MAYDSARHVTVLFGGALNAGFYNDTWQYDGTDWTQVITAHAPSARRGTALAFDSARGVTVLFGGQGDITLNDTWEFNGTVSAPPMQVTAISAFGGSNTYAPFAPPAPPAQGPARITPETKNNSTDRFEQKPLGAPKKPN